MSVTIRAGFMPLVDAALLVVARRLGFAEEEGIDLVLSRETSWAAIRDKLAAGLLDAAHCLAPAAVAASIGLMPGGRPLVAPVALSLNGNAITLSPALHAALLRRSGQVPVSPGATAAALKGEILERKDAGAPPLTFAHVFPFSTHHYQLRMWLREGGIAPDDEVRLVVVPPPQMVSALESGSIDGFCVGAPWNSIAVANGTGVIVHFGSDIAPNAPEKILALAERHDQDDPATTEALVRAIARAAAWAADPQRREELAVVLAGPDVLGVDPILVGRILAGSITLAEGGPLRNDAAYVRLDPGVLAPDPSHADWILTRMAEAGQIAASEAQARQARAVYRPDRFAAAMAGREATS